MTEIDTERLSEREVIARFISPNAFSRVIMGDDRPDLVANAQAYALERADKILDYLDYLVDKDTPQ